MKKRITMMTSLLLVCAIVIGLAGCSTRIKAMNLMKDIKPNTIKSMDDLSANNVAVTDFAVRLFQASEKSGENTLISPLSALCALSMTANGAQGETLAQMERVLGMTTGELNLYLYSYMKNLPRGNKYKMNLANSIWFTDDDSFTVNRSFLQSNADYYSAAIYETPFNKQTCKDINNWIKRETDGMIPTMLDEVPADAVMYLVNALAFEAEWMEIYEKNQVKKGTFTKEDGTRQDATFLNGTESLYLEDEQATGFMKKYNGGQYAFVALLPKDGISVSEYVAALDGADLHAMLSNPQHTTVYTTLPKFETEYDVEMSGILKGMGMPNAFNSNADFSGISPSGIYISRVLHKTFISVAERGTKAGAATAVEMNCTGYPQDPKEVYPDRPFVYMLVDLENNIPFFIGTLMAC